MDCNRHTKKLAAVRGELKKKTTKHNKFNVNAQ